MEHGSANQFVSGSAGFLAFPARRHQSIGPEASQFAGTVRQSGRLTLSFSGGSAACGAHDSIGPAHPHAHKRGSQATCGVRSGEDWEPRVKVLRTECCVLRNSHLVRRAQCLSACPVDARWGRPGATGLCDACRALHFANESRLLVAHAHTAKAEKPSLLRRIGGAFCDVREHLAVCIGLGG